MSASRVSYENGVAWVPVFGFDGHYEVSARGEIRGLRRGSALRKTPRLLKPHYNRMGYGHVVLCRNNRTHPTTVHRVVCASFWTRRPEHDQVGHLDGNPRNNRAANLVWCSAKENAEHRRIHRRTVSGERSHLSKLTAEQVTRIKSMIGTTTYAAIAAEFDVDQSNIYCIAKGKSWKTL